MVLKIFQMFFNEENEAPAAPFYDLAVMTLTGRMSPLLHPSDAASFGLYDLKNDCFDAAAIVAAGMDPAFFPAVATGYTVAGTTPNGIPEKTKRALYTTWEFNSTVEGGGLKMPTTNRRGTRYDTDKKA